MINTKDKKNIQEFNGGKWQTAVDVRDFIQQNYTPYDGNSDFLAGPTEATAKLWEHSKKKGKMAEFLIWIHQSYLQLLRTVQVI